MTTTATKDPSYKLGLKALDEADGDYGKAISALVKYRGSSTLKKTAIAWIEKWKRQFERLREQA